MSGPFGLWRVLSGFVSGSASRIRSLWRGVVGRADLESEMREEMAQHIELRTEALMRGPEGLSREEAARQARLEFGHVETHRDEARASRGLRFFDQIRFSWLDVKLGLRMLWKHPGLTVVAVFSLAVGIPVGLTPTHLARAIQAPLPDPGGERIRAIRLWNAETTNTESSRYWEYARWRDELDRFEAVGAVRSQVANVSADGETPTPAVGAFVSASAFSMLGTPPSMGRALLPDDEAVGGADVVVIGHELWQSRLEGDPDIVGRTLRIGESPHVIVGVMPEGFHFPMSQEFWLPLPDESTLQPGEGLPLTVFGRLADGVTPDEAQAELAAAGQRMATELPDRYARVRPEVVPFSFSVMGVPRAGLGAMPEFYFFRALALLLLLIPCANVAMLVFARTATRTRELAIRNALGAGRLRIVCQVMTEALVLAVVAVGVGLLAVDWGLGVVRAYAESEVGASLPYWLDLGVTPRAVVEGLGLAVLCAVVAGVIPALRVTGKGIQGVIQRAGSGRAGTRFGGMTSTLIVADVAIAVIVIGFSAALSGRITNAISNEDLIGIPAEEYLAVTLTLPSGESMTGSEGFDPVEFRDRLAGIQREVTERLEAEPEVRAVAVADALPRMDHRSIPFEIERVPDGGAAMSGEAPATADGGVGGGDSFVRYVRTARVDLEYFEMLDQPFLAGRGFNGSDITDVRSTVIVNQTFVDQLLGGRNPLGRRVRYARPGLGAAVGWESEAEWLEIVGVVGHLGANVLEPDVAIYLPAAPGEIHPLRLAVHVSGDPQALASRVREIANDIDPAAVLAAPTTLDRSVQGDWYIILATTVGMVLFVGILIMLVTSGIYALLSFAVSERTCEMGIRIALGARRSVIASLIARRTLGLLVLGALLGMPLAGRFMYSMGEDELPFMSAGSATAAAVAVGGVIVLLIALCACTVPTLRALRVEPTEALRGEG